MPRKYLGGQRQRLLNRTGKENVLELTQEDSDDSISLEVMHRTLLQEDICFVYKDDGPPAGRDAEDLRQVVVQFCRCYTKISCTDDVQRLLHIYSKKVRMLQSKTKAERGRLTFARCLCGQAFANTRVSE